MTAAVMLRRREADPSAGSALPPDLHPLLRCLFAQRGVNEAADLDLSLARLHPPSSLGGMQTAVDLLERALEASERIVVLGDYDVDGATSTSVLVRALHAMGATGVRYLVPNRFEFGYGLTPPIAAVAADLDPDLLITVDNGISSIEGVRAARELGMTVIVTDHHLPGATLPEADAIVNPNLSGDPFPSKHLAGVGVAFYLMVALRARLRESGWFAGRAIAEPNLANLIDLVALGTVADVVPLDRNNRILVEQGLRRVRSGRGNPGIQALFEVAGRDARQAVSSDFGFAAGPRLNAAGRLADMSLGIRCLLEDDLDLARHLAHELDALNRERREIESRMRDEALAIVDRLPDPDRVGGVPDGICLYDAGWHQGVIGILASRIRERFNRPAVVFADGTEGELKGSARSVPGVHIRDLLDTIACRNPGLMSRFGGHAMAAGLSLPRDKLDAFVEAFSDRACELLSDDLKQACVVTDGPLEETDLTLEAATILRHAAPWGQGFPEPLFDGAFEVLDQRVLGERHMKLKLKPHGSDRAIDAICFRYEQNGWEDGDGLLSIAYRMEVNAWRGRTDLQLVVERVLGRE